MNSDSSLPFTHDIKVYPSKKKAEIDDVTHPDFTLSQITRYTSLVNNFITDIE